MKAKKTIALVLMALLVSSIFVACSKDEKTQDGDEKKEVSWNKTGLPIVNEPFSLTIASFTGTVHEDGFEGIAMVDRWEEETGITIEWDTVPSANWETRKTLLFTSDELPDAITGNVAYRDDEITTLASQEVIIPLQDLIAEYGVNLNAILEDNPHYRYSMMSPEGEIYSYPAHADIDFGYRGGVTYFNKVWLEEIGREFEIVEGEFVDYIKDPITTDEFVEILKEFKALYPDSYPFLVEKPSTFNDYYTSFGVDGTKLVKDDAGNVTYNAINPDISDGINWVHSMYKDGLIDPEIISQDWATYISKMQRDPYQYGAVNAWTIQQAYDMGDPRYDDWIVLPPLTGPTGITEWPQGVSTPTNGFTVITAACEYPEIAARFFDYMYSEYNSMDLMIGPIGSAAIAHEDGSYTQLPIPEGLTHNEFVARHNPGNMPFLCPPSLTNKSSFNEAVAMTVEVGQIYRPYQVQRQLPKLMLSPDDNQTVADYNANADDFVERKIAEWIQNGNVEEEWDDYVAELEAMGSAEYVEIYQNAYTNVLANQ